MSETKRLSLNLPLSAYELLMKLGKAMSLDLTTTIKFALGLFFLHCDEKKNGDRLVVIDKKGKMIKEIIFASNEINAKPPEWQ